MFPTSFVIILILCSLINENLCYDCGYTSRTIQLDNEGETGIASQPSSCYQGLTVVAQSNDQNKQIKIRFTVVPSNFDIRVYDGNIGDNNYVQNCPIQNGSICYSSGNTVTFYFVPINAFGGYNNQVEIAVIPYYNTGLIASFSFLTIFFCASSFVYQTLF